MRSTRSLLYCRGYLWICDDCTLLNPSPCPSLEVDMGVYHDEPAVANVLEIVGLLALHAY